MNRQYSLLWLALLCAVPVLVRAADYVQTANSITIYHHNHGVPHINGPTDAACAFGSCGTTHRAGCSLRSGPASLTTTCPRAVGAHSASVAAGAAHAVLGNQTPSSQQTPPASSVSRSVWDGVFTEEQAKRGEPLYYQTCSSCHGAKLAGSESAPALAGRDFIEDWDGRTVGDLFKRIRRTMPQDDPGRLSEKQSTDVLAYILSLNKFPNGQAALPQQSDLLQQIRIEAKPDPK
jgi:S-disulfanyl-L-cysteine oxidoreductase SoxD